MDGALSGASALGDEVERNRGSLAGAPAAARHTGRPGIWREPADYAPLLRHERRSLALSVAVADVLIWR